MLAKIKCFALDALEGIPVDVEADVSKSGKVSFEIVGLPDMAVKEAKERVRSAIRNSGLEFPLRRITLNLAPADIKKEGSMFDLPIALCVLKASGQLLSPCVDGFVFLGELALDGSVRGVDGILPIIISAKSLGYTNFIIPRDNAKEASYIEGINVYPADNLRMILEHFDGFDKISPVPTSSFSSIQRSEEYSHDLKYIKGQLVAKRAMEVAVAGGHNILLVGPPGVGKTMLAKTIPTIMPALTFEEALEVTKIHSVAGILDKEGIVSLRPFRSPHHTATTVSLCGGGTKSVHPGEISLAHNGVLFLDEIPEYNRQTLESLRQPLEDGVITVTRSAGSVTYPANFMLVASMNPCPCGNYGSEKLRCTCSANEIKRYRARVSGPLLDRIDIQIQVDNLEYDDLISSIESEDSATVRERVQRSRNIQNARFDGKIYTNAAMGEKEINEYCKLDENCERILKSAFERLNLSARARARIIKVARTIADLALSEEIRKEHILEAIGYRTYDKSGI